ncbi:hypothetical protein TanjilG_10492 [Lupinus angustifolius]|uniref:MBD domain-containing protein n=1 Tax=Lupinus angustifolius TaxID=3871 RepID=A0A4P1R4T7_LUPAN|nr:PREDICTED: uncharacterized protein LOC109359946 [Lupinus angustifolius]OIW01331.1 hypothetical protein TanjilG_10492 [Lupinus angustifolius]
MKQESHNPSMEQVNAMSEVHPLHLVVDKELHDQIVTFLTEQMIELIKESEKENNKKKDVALVEPPISMVGAVDVGATINKRKRIQIQDNKPYGETIGTLQLPNNCILNNIDLDNVQLLTQSGDETSMVNKNPKFSVTERLMNWKIKYEIQNDEAADDIYYYHSQSNLKFGSKLEVIKFVLSETYPKESGSGSKVETWSHEPIDNKRVKVENVESENLVEPVLTENVAEDAIKNHIGEDVITENENVTESVEANQLDEAVINNHLVEPVGRNQLAEPVVGNQGPKLTSNSSTPYPYPDEEIYELMSTEDMLKEFELHCEGGLN